MILYIHKPYRLVLENPPDINDEDREFQYEDASYLRGVLNRFGVQHTLEDKDSGLFVTLALQKVTLDEIRMNTMLDALRSVFAERFKFEFGHYGGAGCEFSLYLLDKESEI